MTEEPDAVDGVNRRLRAVAGSLWHPGILLAVLDALGLAIAGYLSFVELRNELPSCAIAKGCETVATSPYSRIDGIPVAVFGVLLSAVLLVLALAWWRTNRPGLLLAHYSLSFVGVAFEGYFTYLELFVIGAVCMWCALYAISLLARFLITLAVWLRRDRYRPMGASRATDRPSGTAVRGCHAGAAPAGRQPRGPEPSDVPAAHPGGPVELAGPR